MNHSRIAEINAHWATRLNCSIQHFEQRGTTILPSEEMQARRRIIVTRTQTRSMVQVPPQLMQFAVDRLDTTQITTLNHVMVAFQDVHSCFGWRDFVWYFPPESPLAAFDRRVCLLKKSDAESLETLLRACSEDERESGDVNLDQTFPVGLFENGTLLAVAALIVEGNIADVGVLTHPEHRGRGLGKAVVTELVRRGIEQGYIVQYTTQQENAGSKRLAESLGFSLYAIEEGLRLS